MKIHEYQAKAILSRFDIPVPRGKPAFSAEEALTIARDIGFPCVIKAQIHAGGRGKAGGVKLVHNAMEAAAIIDQLLGQPLVTIQTGPQGKVVNRLLIEEGIQIDREFYAGLVVDRARARPVFMVSTEGGVEIEQVAAHSPQKIHKLYATPGLGLFDFQFRNMVNALGIPPNQQANAITVLQSLYRAFWQSDASLVEINPLVLTAAGELLALDAKINFDDNALYRHPDYLELRDLSEEDPVEVEASQYHLNYIRLDGNVGCMVNGAGLAMATMDIIKHYGGAPANFLDVGGIASPETVANGFKIILSDPTVQAILVNIFGGIVRCDRVARGIINAAQSLVIQRPVVIRLEGTNATDALQLLRDSGINFKIARDLREAAQMAVAAVQS